MRSSRVLSRRGGFALPMVLLFLTLAFGAWAVLFRSSGSVLRVEQARAQRDTRNTWTAPAMASALRLLQTGTPPADPYACKLALTQESQTRYFLLSFESVSATRWTVTAAPTAADNAAPDAPATFAVPIAPTGLTATPLSASQIDLAWTDVPDDTGYRVERSADGSTGWTEIGMTTANGVDFSDSGLSAGTTYYYRVRASGAVSSGPYSATASATTTNTPAAPSGLTPTVLSATSVRLDWIDNATNEISFRVQRSTNGTSWTNSGLVGADVTTRTVTGLTTGQLYYFRVRANGSSGNSAWSNVITAIPS